ncbi:MAG TPA: hypothetical protein VHC69_24685 [Polyangiaceae bacterium]|nr:hypothetical protein [Polyangiaceae bacterium]
MRPFALALGAALFAQAPLQCSRDPGPELGREETPPEALYGLATRFKAKGDVPAYRDTLSYLVERYPSSRFAVMAKDELAARHDGGAAAR